MNTVVSLLDKSDTKLSFCMIAFWKTVLVSLVDLLSLEVHWDCVGVIAI